jgi:hypothetical protein
VKAFLCHPDAKAQHLRDLGHLYSFDFDLYRCDTCDTAGVYAWSEYGSELVKVTDEDRATMLALPDAELRPFMRVWAGDFN